MKSSAFFLAGIVLSLIVSCGDQSPYPLGKSIYERNCRYCHMDNGRGLGDLYPDLTKSAYLQNQKSLLPCLIKQGVSSSRLSTVVMPPHPHLTEADITNLINYMSATWGDGQAIQLQTAITSLDQCP